jgi:membrane protease subunit HflC
VLLATAQATADTLRGQGEAAAIATYAQAFGQDPQFFSVWRTLQAYRDGLAGGQTRIVLSTDDDFLKLLKQAPASPPP